MSNPAHSSTFTPLDTQFMRRALGLAQRAYGLTSPNPMVGAVLTRSGRILGQGYHHQAGLPHAEIEALANARSKGFDPAGSTLYVTLEPCCTFGRTPPCTQAILQAGIRELVVAAVDPNPAHAGNGLQQLRQAGVRVRQGLLANAASEINAPFNHWIIHRTPLVTLKAAMTLDGKIATRTGHSKWITSEPARALAMRQRLGADAILAGVNTVLRDNPHLTFRGKTSTPKILRRVVLDSQGRTPLDSHVVSDENAALTTIVVTEAAPQEKIAALRWRCQVWLAPTRQEKISLPWLLKQLGRDNITSLLVEGGGETHGAFLDQHLAHRIAFFYAPIVLGGAQAPKAAAGAGVDHVRNAQRLTRVRWRRLGPDLLLTARILLPD